MARFPTNDRELVENDGYIYIYIYIIYIYIYIYMYVYN